MRLNFKKCCTHADRWLQHTNHEGKCFVPICPLYILSVRTRSQNISPQSTIFVLSYSQNIPPTSPLLLPHSPTHYTRHLRLTNPSHRNTPFPIFHRGEPAPFPNKSCSRQLVWLKKPLLTWNFPKLLGMRENTLRITIILCNMQGENKLLKCMSCVWALTLKDNEPYGTQQRCCKETKKRW